MTGKRFKLDSEIGFIDTQKCGGDTMTLFEVVVELNKLNEENGQLKQFQEKVFSWIDKEIAQNEEAIEWGKETGANSGAIGFYNHMLNRLKKELQE